MESIDDFSKKINLTKEQTEAVKQYIAELLLDHLKSMKIEYDAEIDRAIESLTGKQN